MVLLEEFMEIVHKSSGLHDISYKPFDRPRPQDGPKVS